MTHLTQCSICKQIVAISTIFETYRLIGMNWSNHNRICYAKSKQIHEEFEFYRYYPK